MENYQVSLGVIKALIDAGIKIPEEVALIGIDVIPKETSFFLDDIKLTQIEVPHTERASLAVALLLREIEQEIPVKCKVLAPCKLVVGNTV